jgi:hypothetical protein
VQHLGWLGVNQGLPVLRTDDCAAAAGAPPLYLLNAERSSILTATVGIPTTALRFATDALLVTARLPLLTLSVLITRLAAPTAAAGRWLCSCCSPSACGWFGLWCWSLALGGGYLRCGCRGGPLS